MQVVSILVLWTGIEWKWVTGSSAIQIVWPGTNFDPIRIENLGLKSEDFWEGVFNPLDRSPPLNRPLTPPPPCYNCVPGSSCLNVRSGDNPNQPPSTKRPPRGAARGSPGRLSGWTTQKLHEMLLFLQWNSKLFSMDSDESPSASQKALQWVQ